MCPIKRQRIRYPRTLRYLFCVSISVILFIYLNANVRKIDEKCEGTYFIKKIDTHFEESEIESKKSDIDLQEYLTNWAKQNDLPVPILTLFTTWSNKSEKATVITNTIKNWGKLSPLLSLLLFTSTSDEYSVKAMRNGWLKSPVEIATDQDIPILKHMFQRAKNISKTPFYCFANSDILFSTDLLDTIFLLYRLKRDVPLLAVGQRTEVFNVTASEASNFHFLEKTAKGRGKRHGPEAVDYFITTPDFPFQTFPDLVIGRSAIDNYVIMHARANRVLTVDATETITAVHQTTEAGNFESQGYKHSNYNKDLLKSLYGVDNYDGGQTTCTNFLTNFNISRQKITACKRLSKPKHCGNLCLGM